MRLRRQGRNPVSVENCAKGHTVFESALGWIGIGWSADGVTHVQLPRRDRKATEAGLLKRGAAPLAGEPPPPVKAAIGLLVRYAAGERIDFAGVRLDLSGVDDFRHALYARMRALDYGETVTYGGLADAVGRPGMARDVGQAMGTNPFPIIVPCHRVLAAGGKMGGFSAPGGVFTKRRLLDLERARPPSPPGQSAFAF
jgi:methylated-DNA-[protein]-cysteine S-methyltransferase